MKDRLENFMIGHLSHIDVSNCNLFDALEGVHFLPVNKDTYLLIQCFVNLTENGFPQIRYSAFIYDHYLVWSGMEQDDLRCLYRYVVGRMGGAAFGAGVSPSGSGSGSGSRGKNGFLTGPEDLHDDASPLNCPQVFLGPELGEYRLVIYQQQRVTMLLACEPESVVSMEFFRLLHSNMSPAISTLAAVMESKPGRGQGPEDQYRFLYFNKMNLALKTSIRTPWGSKLAGNATASLIPREVMAILSDMHKELTSGSTQTRDLVVRTGLAGEGWVLGRRSDQREFYVLFDKASTLAEVDADLKRLSAVYFGNVFLD
jgi:hypothetical protein